MVWQDLPLFITVCEGLGPGWHNTMQRVFRIAFVEKQSKDALRLLLDDHLSVSTLYNEVCSDCQAHCCVSACWQYLSGPS